MNTDSFETVVVETDLLILGGGMAACGAAYEASYWAKKHKQRVCVVDKAVSYTHLTLPTTCNLCRSRWARYH